MILKQEAIDGIIWPALVGTGKESLESLLKTLEHTQFWLQKTLEHAQAQQLSVLVKYAAENSPYFKQRLEQANINATDIQTIEDLHKLPVMTRLMLQANIDLLVSRRLHYTHAPVTEVQSSGSTGKPVIVLRTHITNRFWEAYVLRDHLWHKRNFLGKLAVIRVQHQFNETTQLINWGPPTNILFNTGPSYIIPIKHSVDEQARCLASINPDYLLIYPNNLATLLGALSSQKIVLDNLKQIRTIAETVSDELRMRTREELGVSISDCYSSQEVGYIAIQCPHSDLYHVMAENLIVEILNEENNHCKEGEIGRVIVTDLHNFATPLIRYDTEDYAEVGPKCNCGRGLPTLRRIHGRYRNMAYSNGKLFWPTVGGLSYRSIAPVQQFQLIQQQENLIEVRLVSERPITKDEEVKISQLIWDALDFKPNLSFVYYEKEIPRSMGGKFEEYIRNHF